MDVIGDDLKAAFAKIGKKAEIELVLAPAWTTDWISEAGNEKWKNMVLQLHLRKQPIKMHLLGNAKIVKCTNCGSTNTQLVSQFGSTACKALFKCDDCQEPFDYFKCLK